MSCKSCKQKKPVTKLEPLYPDIDAVPTLEDIKTAYHLMSSAGGVNAKDYPLIQKVYKFLFNEDLNVGCGGCASNQFRKFEHYIKETMKLDV